MGRRTMSELEPETFDPQKRRLCPDGDCVGVVGPDGLCRVCGAVDDGAPAPGLGADAFAGGCASEEPEEDERAADGPPGAGGFDPNRVLCLDGSCLGVIGADGRCSECGRPSGPAAASE
jgi:hypothetical protein